ncbi:MAG TPA: beta-ketoacyl synthase N-terminal-like domain-containing protein, partial [Polyangium sp.]|nr:beta-ketoacyl synthase N-terminal-like domain-containing protein [Polyangium sp.]
MSSSNILEYQNRLRDALAFITQLKSKLEIAQRTKGEPIAIIGMGCRFPGGGSDPDSFFRALLAGADGIREVPEERWAMNAVPDGQPEVRWAGLLESVADFDAGFFEISPREAQSLDPQQRLLLEIVWEALDHAGQKQDRLKGSKTGVFFGLSSLDYQQRCFGQSLDQLDGFAVTGNMPSTAAGRISFTLGLQGPCMIVDTACSSSLVAVHLACQSLRSNETDLALAGGVNLILAPLPSYLMARLHALSPDGRCKTFDARANGYVRGEGCGVIILKRLSEAIRDRDRVLAIIRGSAVNQDGRSTGLTTPNVLAQEAVIRQALAIAKIAGPEVGYVETHGTGTPLGDPVEIEALRNVLGDIRPDGTTCVLGAVKTNVGHLEAAAGIAGLIKTVLILQNGVIPKNLHFQARNPRIDIDGTALEVSTTNRPWPRTTKIRRAGISSFGISGTNAHVVLEEAPVDAPRNVPLKPSAYLLPLSAKNPRALSAVAKSYADWFAAEKEIDLHDVVHTASLHRMHFEYRLAAVAGTREEFASLLAAFARGEAPAAVAHGRASSQGTPRIAFVFSGQGSQWAGMGRILLDEEPRFRARVTEIDALVRRYAPFSLLNELRAPEETSRLDETEIVQPAVFALQVGLVDLFDSWGILPDAVVGHSVGEIAAAYVSGALTLDDAVRIVVLRGRIMQKATGLGKMVWASIPPTEAARILTRVADKVSIAAINDPSSVVLSGESKAIDSILEQIDKRGIVTRPLRVNYAFHSPQMEPLARELIESLKQVDSRPTKVTLYSTVTGSRIDGDKLGLEYWGENIRATVNLAAATRAILADGHRILVEIGAHPVLATNLEQCAALQEIAIRTVPTLRRRGNGVREIIEAIGALHTEGVVVDWKKTLPEESRLISLPNYPWQRDRHWIEPPKNNRKNSAESLGHPLLGIGFAPASQPRFHVWERHLSLDALPYLDDHRIGDQIVFPGSGYVEMALAAAAFVHGEGATFIEEINFESMLLLTRDEVRIVQLSLVEEVGGCASITISSKLDGAKDWTLHASGTLRVMGTSTQQTEALTPMDDRLSGATTIDARQHYERMLHDGLSYGRAFQGVEQVQILSNGEVVARIRLPEDIGDVEKYRLHPALLDACFQGAAWTLRSAASKSTFIPAKIMNVRFLRRPEGKIWLHGRIIATETNETRGYSFVAHNESGEILFQVGELRLQALNSNSPTSSDPFEDCIFQVTWRNVELSENTPHATPLLNHWLVILDEHGLGSKIAEALRSRGARVTVVSAGREYARNNQDQHRLDPTNVAHWDKLLESTFAETGCRGVLHCGALDGARWPDTTEATILEDTRRGPLAILRLVQSLLKQGWRDVPRLYLVTRAAQAVGTTPAPLSIGQSTIWGLGRVIAAEQPSLRCTLVDLAPQESSNEATFLMRELLHNGDEDQVAWRTNARFVARLTHGTWTNSDVSEFVELAGGRPYRLEIRQPGVLEKLALRPIERRPPGPGEVEIEVSAAGLNFLDLMKAMGIYPGMDRNSIRLGGECAGRIVAMGSNASGFEIGQEVLASASSAFASHVTTRTEFVAPKPPHLSFEQASTIPAVFMTVYWALHHVGRLQPGERILIHSASGGTGLAAIQYAKSVGAEIFATAGSEEKRAYLQTLGIRNVMNSRTLAFADEIRSKTNGRGVDVVLNSLAGDALRESLEVLAPYGRFLDIGKKDIYENTRLGLLPFRKSLSYSAIDLAAMGEERPQRLGALLHEVVAEFQNGTFQPEPVTTFVANEAEAAFRLM